MDYEFSLLRETRQKFYNLTDTVERKKLLEIPPGFRNNIMWNTCHVLVSQQLMCYRMSGLPTRLSPELIDTCRKGTSPADWREIPPLDALKNDLLLSVDDLVNDYGEGKFLQYEAYQTSYGPKLNCIEDAIRFNNVHEGLHLGYCMAMLKSLSRPGA